jgi:hypothetical protein
MSSTVIISDPFGGNSVRVPVNDVSRSWSVESSGSLSCQVMSDDLIAAGLNSQPIGYWIEIDHDDAGYWGGEISDVQPSGDGTTEIAAEDWTALFAGRQVPNSGVDVTGPAGSIAWRLLTESTRIYGTPITTWHIDDLSNPLTVSLNGGDLRGALNTLARESGQDWWIDSETLELYWGYRGTDLTGSIQLCEPRHILDWRAPRSLPPIVNVLEAFPLDATDQRMQTIVVQDATSIGAVGVRQGSAGFSGGLYGADIRPAAEGLVSQLSKLGHSIELEISNIDRCWSWFREGDTICALLPTDSTRATMRIMARAISDRQDVMSVSGVVTDWQVL